MVNVDRSCVSLNVDCLDDTRSHCILLACIGIALGIYAGTGIVLLHTVSSLAGTGSSSCCCSCSIRIRSMYIFILILWCIL